MNSLKKLAGRISYIELYIACLSLLVLTFLMTIGVFARYLFNAPLVFGDEISIYLFVIIIFFGLEYTWIKREHIRIEFIIQHIPAKSRNYLEGVLHILWLGFCALLLAGTLNLVISFYQQHVHAFTVLGTALWVPALIMPIGIAIFLVRLLADTYQYLSKLFRGKLAFDRGTDLPSETKRESD